MASAGVAGQDTPNPPPPAKNEEAQPDGEEGEGDEWRVMAENYKEQGNEAFKGGRYSEAIDCYTRALDLDPDNHVVVSNRSATYLKMDERGKALKDAERLMELKPDWPKSYSRKAAAQHALTRYEAAIETYQEGLRQFPEEKALKDGLKAAEQAYELDKKARFEKAKLERQARELELKEADKRLEEAKAKAAANAKRKREDDEKKKAGGEDTGGGPSADDDLAGFFSELGGGSSAAAKKKDERIITEVYQKADLGTSEEQVERLLQSNYQWKNLNPYEVLGLDIDATEEDIKLRYRKLSTLVHPDKCLHLETAREAFEEVKKAYNQLMEPERRTVLAATIENTRKRTLKDRKHKLSKGVTLEQLGPEDEALKKAVMKEFAEIELRRRNSDKHEQAYKQYEQKMEDDAKEKMRKEMEFDKSWTDEGRREGRVGNWRDFQSGPGGKRAKVQSWSTEENTKKSKHGQHKKEEWRKSWK